LILSTETAKEAIQRVIYNKLNINPKNVYIEELKVYSDIDRDKRGRVVSLAHIGLITSQKINNIAATTYVLIEYTKAKNLAYDHDLILKDALQRLRDRFLNSTIAVKLLPNSFTITELYQLYCLILNKKIDKRNFLKKIKSLGIIKKGTEKVLWQKHRPVQLFEFKSKEIKNLNIF